MEYPRHLHQPNGRYVVCDTPENHEQLAARGWTLLPEAHVEQPVYVSLYDALQAEPINAKEIDFDENAPEGISALSVKDAEAFIAAADAEALATIEAEETEGKARKGVLALIEARKAELSA